ncbi:ABC transporter substrate-binding protein [Sporanaerobacter acetigenes]|uniref:Peptide/nickel transport system substrate-binding protein n=1 Tax=Sporanaerobacter acetigenes DSM 13106 TaxID=1123281 RepID=A0A1M5VRP2_9FIRM|nr:ABC transporter substrate-binding protein [Sporanaerobacter acetigenes]SHH77936.1 peptide/nickel transport system substrate-binding protein [Sporanaerobacter acetigenes DSM 13106]
MKMRKLSLFLVIVLCCGLFAGCGNNAKNNENGKVETNSEKSDGPKDGGVYVVSIAGDPQGFNPCAQPDDNAYGVFQNVFNRLVKLNGHDEMVSDLAKEWEYSEDGKTLTFHLNENIKWHDGEDFSSEDVKWTFDQIIQEKGFASGFLSDVEEIVCPDKNTVEFKLKNPNAGLLGYIGWYGTFIMPKHIYEGTDWLQNEANQKPIGTGPFKFVEHKKGVNVTLERNDDYWGEKPHLDKVIFSIIPDQSTAFQAYLNGETDENLNGIPYSEANRFDDDPNYVVEELLWMNRTYLTFNFKEGKFADQKVRQAVAYGVDRDEIFSKALKGMGQKAEYFVSPLFDWALNEDVKLPERDIEKAKSLLEEAGYKQDANGMYFSTTLDTFPGFEDVVEVVQANLKEIGIDVKVNQMEMAAWDEKVFGNKDFEITLLAGYQGPDISAISNRVGANGATNIAGYNNPKVEELLAEGLVLTSQEERAPMYKELQEILAEDLPLVPLNENGAKKPIKSYIKGHPATEASDKASESEYTYVWLDK